MANADLVILGGGSGGYACALRAAELGMSVILIDKDKLGGTCLHWGCIPTKAWVQTAHALHDARETFAKLGVGISEPRLDFAQAAADLALDMLGRHAQGHAALEATHGFD